MTTATLADARELRTLSDAELAGAYSAGVVTFADLQAECARRDAADKRAATIRARQSEWLDAAHADYLRADIECRGELLSPLGKQQVTDPMSLWRGSEATAMRWASEELREWWYVNGRLTPASFARGLAASKRAELETYRAERAACGPADAGIAADLGTDAAAARRAAPRPAVTLVRPAPRAVRPVVWPALAIPRAASRAGLAGVYAAARADVASEYARALQQLRLTASRL